VTSGIEVNRLLQNRIANLDAGAIITSVTDVTRILDSARQGNPNAAEELLPLVYDELKKLAAQKMAQEAPGHTLQPTALVHEAWLRLMGDDKQNRFQNRAHFFSAAAESMRRILIDRARRKRAARHGGDQERVELEELNLSAIPEDDQILALSDALDKLAKEHQREAELVKLRYFVGLTIDEAAVALGISPRTAKYYWTHARAWLYQEITQS
jgi:RNA polymerase sigma factor (TIGR02999 family)